MKLCAVKWCVSFTKTSVHKYCAVHEADATFDPYKCPHCRGKGTCKCGDCLDDELYDWPEDCGVCDGSGRYYPEIKPEGSVRLPKPDHEQQASLVREPGKTRRINLFD